MTCSIKLQKIPLSVLILVLLFFIVLFFFFRRFLSPKNPKSDSSSPQTSSQSTVPQDFQATLTCLPPQENPPCTFGLLYQQKVYSISGLSQASLELAEFQHGQVLTVSGAIQSDQIVITSLSGN